METNPDTRRETFEAAQFAIRLAVEAPRSAPIGRNGLRIVAEQDRELFFDAALAFLADQPESRKLAAAYARICEQPEFLLELVRPDRFSRPRLLELCARIAKYEKRLDLRLASLLPSRYEDQYHLPADVIARILDVLNEISVGPRLVLPLSHLTEHPDAAVAERAVVLMGRRIQNSAWPQRRLSSGDEAVRAGALEAMWGHNSATARAAMWNSINDASHQVVGNAVFGLHLLGDSSVGKLVAGMIHDSRPPFRSAAARVLGKIGKQEYAQLLAQAAADGDPGVRLEAKRALAAIQRVARQQEEAAVGKVPSAEPVPKVEAPVPETPEPEAPEPEFDLNLHLDGRHTSMR